jgi:hypothetical protein
MSLINLLSGLAKGAGKKLDDLGFSLDDVIDLVKRQEEAKEIPKYGDVPVIDARDLVGESIGVLPADLLRTGGVYEGIDAAGTTRLTPLTGGPLYGNLPQNIDAGLGFASKGKEAKGTPNLYTVSAMGERAHQSNEAFMNALQGTIEAYIDSGRLNSKNLAAINNEIRKYGDLSKQTDVNPLSSFPGFESPDIDEYIANLSFNSRAALVKKLAQPGMQKLGVPNMQRILQETIQPEFSGVNPLDSLLLIKPDNTKKLINLAEEGLPTNLAYTHGMGGEIVGRFENPLSYQYMFPEFTEQFGSLGGIPRSATDLKYTFEKVLPEETMTSSQAELISEAVNYPNISPRKFMLLRDGLSGNWKVTGIPVNQGGLSPVQFARNLENNASYASLEPYTPQNITKMIKDGSWKSYALGDDSSIQFALQKNPDYSWMGLELGPNEIDLVGVVSNELGAKGLASPAVLGKAVEEGATILNAFAVKSAKYPDGKLPTTYKQYGFKPIKTIAFDSKYYIDDRGQAAYDDLLNEWKRQGWSEKLGFPDVVAMKWIGTEKERINASKRVFDEDFEGFGRSKTTNDISPTEEAYGQSVQSSSRRTRVSGENNGRRDSGNLRDDNGGSQSNRIGTDATALKNLTPTQLRNINLGALPKGVQ